MQVSRKSVRRQSAEVRPASKRSTPPQIFHQAHAKSVRDDQGRSQLPQLLGARTVHAPVAQVCSAYTRVRAPKRSHMNQAVHQTACFSNYLMLLRTRCRREMPCRKRVVRATLCGGIPLSGTGSRMAADFRLKVRFLNFRPLFLLHLFDRHKTELNQLKARDL